MLAKLSPFFGRHYVSTGRMIGSTPVADAINRKLEAYFQPIHVEVLNESYMHNVPKGSETHFKVLVVSQKFEKLPLIQCHRLVNEVLSEELKNGVHALSIVAKTPDKWDTTFMTEKSPACRGGFGK
ncbi:bolA-like protein DDB_G0274169 [Artemia franciscana]|uniref:BolA-like protein n=1 Tax=Artemia franciscana TaxID=6661 RepID=A0AA88IBT7_ARTSF|nr:hypothetical protein QYM36_000209 [Artemia franciscana]